MKCIIILWFLTTNEVKEVTFHASSCKAIYEMVQYKTMKSEDIEVLMISEKYE